MLELKFVCDICGAVTTNPTMVHVCNGCARRVCRDCLPAHERAHRGASDKQAPRA